MTSQVHPQPRRLPVVSIVGASTPTTPSATVLARDLGAALKRAGFHMACGGRTGVMDAVSEGFANAEGPGVSLGILMATDGSDANRWLDIVLPTGMGVARNALVAQAGHVVLGIDGGAGTLSELAMAWQYGRPVGVLVPAGGWPAKLAGAALDDKRPDVIEALESVEACVAWAQRCCGDTSSRD
ncbi:MAG: TIGR00725 family protein [Nannocystaceae bacterium]